LNKNPSKSSRFSVEDFEKSVFLFNQGIKHSQYLVLASILTKSERKSAFSKQVWIILITFMHIEN